MNKIEKVFFWATVLFVVVLVVALIALVIGMAFVYVVLDLVLGQGIPVLSWTSLFAGLAILILVAVVRGR